MPLTLEHAQAIITGAKAKAEELGRSCSIAIVDDGGYLVAFARLNGGRWVNVDIAIAKATGAAAFRTDASNLYGMIEHNPTFFQQMLNTTRGRVIIDIGSLVIRDSAGNVVGAVAASGASAEEDEVIVKAGLDAAGAL
jgi:uncharacterized protein GlcG (DUF336 family)